MSATCILHASVCTISARQDDEKKCQWVSASSAAEQQLFQHHLPRLQRFVFNHCQPLQSTALTSISHFIMSYHNSRRLAGSALLGVPWRCSQALLAGLTGLAVLAATTCSHPRLPAGVGGEAMGWAKPPHHSIK